MLTIGIIGCGSRGIECFGRLIKERDDAEIVALCDSNPVRMNAAAAKLSVTPRYYETAESMLQTEKLDAVVITSPDFCHEAHAIAALKSGVHVLIDKPLAITAQGCRNIINAAENNKKIVMMGFNLRHSPVLKRLKAIIDANTIGRILMIENREFYDGGRTYMARWNRRYELCGGLWVHKGSHDFDIFNWLLGFPKPVRVSSFANNSVFLPDQIPFKVPDGLTVGPTCSACQCKHLCPDIMEHTAPEWSGEAVKHDGYHKDLCLYLSDKNVHDSGVAIVEYENGVRASHLECFVTSLSDRLYTVIGDRGQIEVSLHHQTIKITPRWNGEVVTYKLPEPQGGHGGADPMLVEAFVNTLKNEGQSTATVEQGFWATAIGQAAEISARECRMVEISELTR